MLNGCGSSKKVVIVEKKPLPSWYKALPPSSDTNLYAFGEGKNREGAIADALSMMVSTLSVSISSDFHSKTVVQNGVVSSSQTSSTSDIKSSVHKIRISSYELVESQSIGYRKYIVMIKSNKEKLFNSMKSELNQKFYLIEKREESLGDLNAIKLATKYAEFQNSLEDVPNTLIVMGALKSSFDSTTYLDKYQRIERKLNTILKSLTFSIKCNRAANNLKSALSKGLSARKLVIKNSKNKNHFVVEVNSNIQKANSYGFILARSAISIKVRDYRGAIIGSNKLNIVGQSTSNFEAAKESVAFKLNEMIKKEGIAKITGLQI